MPRTELVRRGCGDMQPRQITAQEQPPAPCVRFTRTRRFAASAERAGGAAASGPAHAVLYHDLVLGVNNRRVRRIERVSERGRRRRVHCLLHVDDARGRAVARAGSPCHAVHETLQAPDVCEHGAATVRRASLPCLAAPCPALPPRHWQIRVAPTTHHTPGRVCRRRFRRPSSHCAGGTERVPHTLSRELRRLSWFRPQK